VGFGLADTEQLIREELNDPYVRVAGIGPAGENLVKYAGFSATDVRQHVEVAGL